MKLTFIFAVLASALFGCLLGKQRYNSFRYHGAATWITLILSSVAGVIFCICDSAQGTDETEAYFVLLSTVIGFGILTGIGYLFAVPSQVLNWHSDIFKQGIKRKYCLAINIFIVATWLTFLVVVGLAAGCMDISIVCIATLLTCLLLSLLVTVGCVIALGICIMQIIIWFIILIERSAHK